MNSEELIEAIEKEFLKSRNEYFNYAWREKLDGIIADENKYCALLDWICNKVYASQSVIDAFSPADRTQQYTNSFFGIYADACRDVAMLLHLKGIIKDVRCTTEMRDNVEYVICKIYGVHYNKELGIYV